MIQSKKLILFSLLTSLQLTAARDASSAMVRANIINEIRNSIQQVVGYSSNDSYSNLACGGKTVSANNCDGPPKNGIVGTITDFINQISTVASVGGTVSCAELPSTGSITGTGSDGTSYTLTFATPTHTIPSDWVDGGTVFTHRVTFTAGVVLGGTATVPLSLAVEFDCGSTGAIYAAVSMPMLDSNSGNAQILGHAYNREIALYNGPVDASNQGIEVYMVEHVRNVAHTARGVNLMRIYYNPAANTYQLWSVVSFNPENANGAVVGRLFMHGDYTSGLASILFDGVFGRNSDSPIPAAGAFPSALASASNATTATVPTVTSHAFDTTFATLAPSTGGTIQQQGCVTLNSSSANGGTLPASSDLCTGMAISTPTSAPGISSSGRFTLDWALTTMPELLEQLGTAGPTS